ncbi:MAG: hypothetical protein ABI612_19425 [Betaproteobacteria bacterium]
MSNTTGGPPGVCRAWSLVIEPLMVGWSRDLLAVTAQLSAFRTNS